MKNIVLEKQNKSNEYHFASSKKPVKSVNYGLHSFHEINPISFCTFDGELHVCSKCLEFLPTKASLDFHFPVCDVPFRPFYSEEDFSISLVIETHKKQKLSLLSMCFLKSKTLFYEVENYDFYLIYGTEIYGYFSRHRNRNFSLNCFVVFPPFQGRGFGSVLLDYSQSVELDSNSSKIKNGGIEKPYTWKSIMCFRRYFPSKIKEGNTVNEIAESSNLTVDDTIIGLELLGYDFKTNTHKKGAVLKEPRILKHRIFRIRRV